MEDKSKWDILGYTGISLQRCSKNKVLVNVGDQWQVAKYKDVVKDLDAILKDAEDVDSFMLWYSYDLKVEGQA